MTGHTLDPSRRTGQSLPGGLETTGNVLVPVTKDLDGCNSRFDETLGGPCFGPSNL